MVALKVPLKLRFLPLFALLFAAAPAVAQEERSAIELIEQYHQGLLTVMKQSDTLGVRGRFEELWPEFKEIFHFPLMTRAVAGSIWADAGAAQRRKLEDTFARMSVATFASRFNSYSDHEFKIIGEKPGPRGTTIIETEIRNADDAPVGITYVLKTVNERIGIVDILLGGAISELALRRSEYRRVLKTEGIEGLIARLDKKADELLAE